MSYIMSDVPFDRSETLTRTLTSKYISAQTELYTSTNAVALHYSIMKPDGSSTLDQALQRVPQTASAMLGHHFMA